MVDPKEHEGLTQLAKNRDFTNNVPRAVLLVKWSVAVEKLAFPAKQPKLGDRKCLGEPRKSFTAS